MPHIFISYAQKDTRNLAEKLWKALQAHPKLTAWMDRSLQADTSWALQIQKEIIACKYMVVLISPDVNREETETQGTSFVLKEINFAQQRNIPILPVMVQKTDLPLVIADLQYIDLTQTPDDPEPVVNRICDRFELTTPAQLRQKEAEQQAKRERAAAEEAALQNKKEEDRRQQEALDKQKKEEEAKKQSEVAKKNPSTLPKAASPLPSRSSSSSYHQRRASWRRAEAARRQRMTLLVLIITIMGIFATSLLSQSPNSTSSNDFGQQNVVAGATITPLSTAIPTPTPGLASSAAFTDWSVVEQSLHDVPMVFVPAGCFEMGRNAEGGSQCPGDFWISKYEVTNAQYAQFIAAGGYTNSGYWTVAGWEKLQEEGWQAPRYWSDTNYNAPDHPVVGVSWYEALAYATWRGGTLPTEAQWEYAARGPQGWLYPWGNEFIRDNLVYSVNSGGQSAAVGSRPSGASWVGALDMSGNVWEWTLSQEGRYPYDANDGREDITATGHRYARGGSWYYQDTDTSATYRYHYDPATRFFNVGFRIAYGVG